MPKQFTLDGKVLQEDFFKDRHKQIIDAAIKTLDQVNTKISFAATDLYFMKDKEILKNVRVDDVFDATNWQELTAAHKHSLQELEEEESLDFASNDEDYSWLLDSERSYDEQLLFYEQFEEGNL